MIRLVAIGLVALAAFAAGAQPAARPTVDHVLLVGGLGGKEQYTRDFYSWLIELRTLLVEKHGYESEHVRVSAETPEGAAAQAVPHLETLASEIARLKLEMTPDDTFTLIMVGHGQSDYRDAKFNLPGKDLTDSALAAMLDGLPAEDQRLILSFPCSGQFSETLAREGRVILASTDGPRQVYHSVMTPYLAEIVQTDEADFNDDGGISFYEAFELLSEKVEGYFSAKGALQTENPSLEDNGDGKVTTLAEGMDVGDGERARKTRLVPAPSRVKEKDGPRQEARATTE